MKVTIYEDKFGYSPYSVWLKSLNDAKTVARILARIERLEHGNFGDYKYLEGGIWELRLFFGPGLRVYYAKIDDEIILLLLGGIKSSQTRDIKKAISYLQDYLERL